MLRDRLLGLYEAYPFGAHPYWRAVANGILLHPQVAAAEQQHALQMRAAADCERHSYLGVAGDRAFALFLDQYLDAISATGGAGRLESLANGKASVPTPGTSASIALRSDLRSRGFVLYAIGFGCVSHFSAQVYADAHRAYDSVYHFSEERLVYYREQEQRERIRANNTLGALDELAHGIDSEVLALAVRDSIVTASLGFDGMLQAATNSRGYWGGQ